MEQRDFKRTQFAKMGVDFATLFAAKFQKTLVSGHHPLLQEPPGVSTEGGRQATQHVLLRPETPDLPTLTIGSVNLVHKVAMLRTFTCLQQMHALRYPKKRFGLEASAYQAFIESCAAYLQQHKMELTWESQAPVEVMVPPPPPSLAARSSAVSWLFLLLAVLAVGGGVVWLLHWRGVF